MSVKSKNGLSSELLGLYHSGSEFLQEYPWEFESDRLAELIELLFLSVGMDAKKAGASVSALNQLGMISGLPTGNFGDEQYQFMQRVLIQTGVDEEKAEIAIKLVISVILQVRKKWGGYIQRMLRHWGSRMADDLGGTLQKAGLDEGRAMSVAVSWLQNVANIPILAQGDPHVKNFLKEYHISEEELTGLLDSLGLNVSVADELLTVRGLEKKNGKPASKTGNGRRRGK
jgi:hypothetical protein